VSVVVPAYGVEEWLPERLAGLVAQTHREWEAVVVDDGSPDRSGEIAEEWAVRDKRIRVVHTPNGGLGAARNLGAREVRGDGKREVLAEQAIGEVLGLRLAAHGLRQDHA
ncbi:MAG: glycosyltransferase family 2 protein, partial [Burkholderiales bacterium]